jgi:hypothetical protein
MSVKRKAKTREASQNMTITFLQSKNLHSREKTIFLLIFLKIVHYIREHKPNLNPSLFIKVHVSSQENERSCICVLWVSTLPVSMVCLFDLGTAPTLQYLFYLIAIFKFY